MSQLDEKLAAYIAAEKTPVARRASDLLHKANRTKAEEAVLRCTIQECVVKMNEETK